MRKHVTPADPAAAIPDPSRGRPLPPEGLPVTWGPYWAGLAARDEITVADVPESEAEAEPPAAPATAPPAAAPRTRSRA